MDNEMDANNESGTIEKRGGATGVVTSLSGAKTIVVTVNRLVKHPLYGKYVRRSTKLAAHDAKGEANLGDTVEILPCRPMSKTKSWRLARVVRPAEAPQHSPAGG